MADGDASGKPCKHFFSEDVSDQAHGLMRVEAALVGGDDAG